MRKAARQRLLRSVNGVKPNRAYYQTRGTPPPFDTPPEVLKGERERDREIRLAAAKVEARFRENREAFLASPDERTVMVPKIDGQLASLVAAFRIATERPPP